MTQRRWACGAAFTALLLMLLFMAREGAWTAARDAPSCALAVAVLAALVARYRRGLLVPASALVMVLALAACAKPPPPGPDLEGTIKTLTDADILLFDDGVGTLTEETTGTGKPLGSFATYPYGVTRFDTSDETRKYAGTPRDTGLGLDQMGARSYAPDLGLWTSGDPFAITHPERGVGERFAANNPYAYAADAPTVAVDRDGHFVFLVFAAVVIGSLIASQFANAPESASSPLFHKSDGELALDSAHNAAMVYGAATGVAGAVDTLATQGVARGSVSVATSLTTGTLAATGVHQIADAADPSGKLGKVADIAMVAQGEIASEGLAGRSGPSIGRSRAQERLRQIGEDPNASSADRGWIRQERNAVERGTRTTIRNPPGKQLAHARGREAAKGYDHVDSPSSLQDVDLHRTQHVIDDGGRANKERP